MEQIATQANHVNRSFIDRPYVELISSPSMNALEGLFAGVRSELHIVSPYITSMGTAVITDRVRSVARRLSIRLHLLTDLNPLSVCQGSCDPDAILGLVRAFPRPRIHHLPRVHAKVFVADRKIAIVGSANLTESGLRDNYEYSIKVKSPEVASRVALDVEEYSNLGASTRVEVLESYSRAAIALREVFGKKERATSSSIRKAFDAHLQTGSELLLGARVKEGVTRVLSRTILFLLRAGPLRTADIHPQIKRIHPDLCDDSVDRVIAGERFGKRWKHLVRTAQQILKRERLVEIDSGFWSLSRSAGV